MFMIAFLLAVHSSIVSAASHANKIPTAKYHDIDIPALNVADALNELAEQTDVVMLFPYEDVKARQANAVVGHYSLMGALTILLQGSGLVGSLSDKDVIVISVASNNHHTEEKKMSRKNKSLVGAIATTLVAFFGGGGQLLPRVPKALRVAG